MTTVMMNETEAKWTRAHVEFWVSYHMHNP